MKILRGKNKEKKKPKERIKLEMRVKYLNMGLAKELINLETQEEVAEATKILYSRHNQLQANVLSKLHIGQKVFFIKKDGRRVDCNVERINRKN